MKTNYWVVIPAAGSGSRMGSQVPKQYLLLQNKPILQHTLERLCLPQITGIVISLSESDPYWPHLSLNLPIPLWRAPGGQERCHSVLNGLSVLSERAQAQDWVLVHDAARPCVRPSDINKLINTLEKNPVGGLLALKVRDTMKRANSQGEVSETVDREGLWHALTPQMFRFNLLQQALQSVVSEGKIVTDDAQAIEQLGYNPLLVEGHADNIKITHPQDIDLANLYIQRQTS